MLARTVFRLPAVVLAGLMIWVVAPAPARAADGVTYTFDACEQGWAPSKAVGPQGTWRRMDRFGDGQSWAMAFPLYEGPSTANITSLPHESTGAPVTVSYAARWHFEHPASGTDVLRLEWGTDPKGRVWKTLKVNAGVTNPAFPNFDTIKFTFSPPKGKFHLRFVMAADDFVFGLGPQVDNVKVSTAAPKGSGCGG
ncbi:MAG TPA: hypothetical protein VM030_04785 [Acidimicrobiales bacterium]|nr:hypothetical protein [Acidimicrobiales bacterium]